jgi:hypothetical protein
VEFSIDGDFNLTRVPYPCGGRMVAKEARVRDSFRSATIWKVLAMEMQGDLARELANDPLPVQDIVPQ